MNQDRRKRIAKLVSALEELMVEAESLKDEETEAFENMPEGLQQSERGEQSEAAITELESALCNITDAIEAYGNIE
ncbi:Uncharacterised protein [Yersinia aldovae]|uniref:hypothetical protein n=1 Tax=Yersinia aldovae TaxID=29483 RepID=UPI0005DF7733|nr:hypothetical protein [Yersinia aldovae]CNK26340.1 Uncharacterised protein [Yersinia aldovae]